MRLSASRRDAWLLFAIAFALSLSLYVATLSPGVASGDQAEFQRAMKTLEITHSTGYPLYILLGHLWVSIFPFGSVAWKANLLSGVFVALTVGAGAAGILRLTKCLGCAVVTALFLALGSSLWSAATIAEVYALQALLVLLTLLAFINVDAASSWSVAGCFFLLGLACGHHRMALFIIPGALVYLLSRRPLAEWLAPGKILAILGGFALGFAPYLFSLLHYQWPSLRSFIAYMTGAFESQGWWAIQGLPSYFAKVIWPLMVQSGGAAALIVVALATVALLVGAARLSPPGMNWLLGLTLLLTLLFYTVYRVLDISDFFVQYEVVVSLLAGLGLATARSVLASRAGARPALRAILPSAVVVVVSAMLLLHGWQSWGTQTRTFEWSQDTGNAVFADVEPDAVVVTEWIAGQTLLYQQAVEGKGQGVHVIMTDLARPDPAKIADLLDTNRPVYIAYVSDNRPPQALLERFPLESASRTLFDHGLYRVAEDWAPAGGAATTRAPPQVSVPSGAKLAGGAIELAGYDLIADSLGVKLTLYWHAVQPVKDNWKVFVHLVNGEGRLVSQNDALPVRGSRPTDTWQPGEYIVDRYRLLVPSPDLGRRLWPVIGMFDPVSGDRVPISEDGATAPQDSLRLNPVVPS